MRIRSFTTALLSLTLTFGTAGAVGVLAVAKDRASRAEILTADSCPPGACTIVMKTSTGGPPSELRPAEARDPVDARASGGWAVAAREIPRSGADAVE